MRKAWTLLWGYICPRAALLLALLGVCAFTLAAGELSGEGMDGARYGMKVGLFVAACFLTMDFLSYLRRLRRLDRLRDRVPLPRERETLPRPSGLAERKYQQLLWGLNEAMIARETEYGRGCAETVEYYTLWVHQIKTPLAAMRLVLDEGGGDGAILRQELFQLEHYADLALQFIKLGNIASDLVVTKTDVGRVVRGSVKRFSVPFIYKKLSVSIQPMEWTALTDPKWLEFILGQLLINAVKYTAAGGVTISREGDALVVADTGMGIREEDLPRIFEKGYTGFNGRVDGRASGVGLYLCRLAGDALGLTLSAQSRVGEGTKIYVRFAPEQTLALD